MENKADPILITLSPQHNGAVVSMLRLPEISNWRCHPGFDPRSDQVRLIFRRCQVYLKPAREDGLNAQHR